MSEVKRSVDYEIMFGNLTFAATEGAKSGRFFGRSCLSWTSFLSYKLNEDDSSQCPSMAGFIENGN